MSVTSGALWKRWVLVGAVGGLLAGCGSTDTLAGLHEPPAQDLSAASVGVPSAERITARVAQDVAAAEALPADEAGTAARAAAMSGTALAQTKARIAVTGSSPSPTALTVATKPTVLAISRGVTYPRVILATTLDADTNRQYLETFATAGVLDRFTLENRVRMIPGATLPGLGEIASGASLVEAGEGQDLAMSPQAALEAYAASLSFPTPTAHELVDSTDTYAAALAVSQKKLSDELGTLASYAVSQTSVPEAIRAVRLADGGTVVFGRFDRSDVFTASANTKELTVPAQYQKLVSSATATSSVTITTLVHVVLLIPASGEGKVTALGVDEQITGGSVT